MVFNFSFFTHFNEIADNWEPESSKALASCPSTITIDSLASATSLNNGFGL